MRSCSLSVLFCLLLAGGASACEYYVGKTKMCDELRSVFLDNKVKASEKLLACLKGYWESSELIELKQRNQLKFKGVIEEAYFAIKDIKAEARSEKEIEFLDAVETVNQQFSRDGHIDLYSSKIGFATQKVENKMSGKDKPSQDKPTQDKPSQEDSSKNGFETFLDRFKKQ